MMIAEICFRLAVSVITVAGLGIVSGCVRKAAVEDEEDLLSKARRLNERLILIDTHVDIPIGFATEEIDPGVRNSELQADLVKMREGFVDGVFFIGFTPQGPRDPEGYEWAGEQVIKRIEAIRRICEKMYPERIELATSPADVRRIADRGKLAAMIGVENGYAVGKNLSLLDKYYNLGARYMTLSHIGHNDICDSANPPRRKPAAEDSGLDSKGKWLLRFLYVRESLFALTPQEPEHEGLSEFGETVVEKMNRLGMIVDVSHIASQSFHDVLRVSKAPVVASHSCCRALCDTPRNLDDRQLKALKENRGCIQITTVSSYVKFPGEAIETIESMIRELGIREHGYSELERMYNEDREAYDELMHRCLAEMKDLRKRFTRPDVADLVDHIDHAVRLIGINHVGIGSDFGGGGEVKGFSDESEAVNVTAELLRRGYSERDIEKIWGGNFLRVWSEVEHCAREIRAGDSGSL